MVFFPLVSANRIAVAYVNNRLPNNNSWMYASRVALGDERCREGCFPREMSRVQGAQQNRVRRASPRPLWHTNEERVNLLQWNKWGRRLGRTVGNVGPPFIVHWHPRALFTVLSQEQRTVARNECSNLPFLEAELVLRLTAWKEERSEMVPGGEKKEPTGNSARWFIHKTTLL